MFLVLNYIDICKYIKISKLGEDEVKLNGK
jgi:hypothetical protein